MNTVRTGSATEGTAGIDVRPMALEDVDAAIAVIGAAILAQSEAGLGFHAPPSTASSAQVEANRLAHARFVQHDGPGAWVAESGGQVVGVTESIRRGNFWGLSTLFIDPHFQSRGVGRRLLEVGQPYAAGASQRMIVSSPDPRAMRRYFLAGLSMHPGTEIGGRPDRRALPPSLPGREGGEEDLELVASVEAQLGRARTEDVAFTLSDERVRLDVVDSGHGRGWVLWRPDRLVMLGATDDETAAVLLWRWLAGTEGETHAHGLTGTQQWAFAVAHAARLTVRVVGAVFVDGMAIPGPWVPSGWFF